VKIVFFSARGYDRLSFERNLPGHSHNLEFFETRLSAATAALAGDAEAVCAFVNDQVDAACLRSLAAQGVKLLLLRSAGFNHVDLSAAQAEGITVARVPAYSPHAVAEHAVALLLTLNRKTHKAYNRVREGNFLLQGLTGFDLYKKTVGVIGTGTIGAVFAKIMLGFGCQVLAYDPRPAPELGNLSGLRYVNISEIFSSSDVISLHCPLNTATRHIIDAEALEAMRPGAIIINTGRGALVDTRALIAALKSGRIGGVALDVYEEEEALFFADHSGEVIQDDVFMRLLTFPNVLVTAHQAFFTEEALDNIAATTLGNATALRWRLGRLAQGRALKVPDV
jgi:D-lactate dehydrogenase